MYDVLITLRNESDDPQQWAEKLVDWMVDGCKVSSHERFDTWIKHMRSSMNMTQEEFAEFINVTQPTISSWENGSTRPPPMMWKGLEVTFESKMKEIIQKPIVKSIRRN